MGSQKRYLVIIAIIVFAFIAVSIILISYSSGSEKRIQNKLEQGARYLSELQYEQAIAAYKAVIEIDPKNVDAYLGMAEAYIGMGDYDKALSVLGEGYSQTNDERIADKITELETMVQSAAMMNQKENDNESEKEEPAENISNEERIKGFIEKYEPVMMKIDDEYEISWSLVRVRQIEPSKYFSQERLNEIYKPLIEPLEEYLYEYQQLDIDHNELIELAAKYCHYEGTVFLNESAATSFICRYCLFVNDLEKCKEYARGLYADWDSDEVIDEYGRTVFDGTDSYVYDGNRVKQWTRSDANNLIINEFVYDDSGRIARSSVDWIDHENSDKESITTSEYSYVDEYTVIEKTTRNGGGEWTITLDKYGKEL